MKKELKIIIKALLLLIIFCTIFMQTSCLADTVVSDSDIKKPNSNQDISALPIGTIISLVRYIGIVVAVIWIMVLGIKYMTASVEQKADYKRTFLPYLIGAILLFAGTNIVAMIYNMTTRGQTYETVQTQDQSPSYTTGENRTRMTE